MNQSLPTQENIIPRFFQMLPANILSNIMLPLTTIFSTAFLGHLEEIHHLAGVALAGNLFCFLFLIFVSLRMSTTGLTAQAMGREDREETLLVGLRNFIIALLFGIALIIFQYPMQQLGLSWVNASPDVIDSAINYYNVAIWGAPATLINFVLIGWFLGIERNGKVLLLSFVGNITNILANYLLIVRWNFASTGAGISSVMSQYIFLLLALIFLFHEIQWQELKSLTGKVWHSDVLKSTLTLNSNLLINNTIFILTVMIFNYQGVGLGTTTYAENALLIEIFNLNACLAEGVGFGIETLCGNFIGKGISAQLKPSVGIGIATSLFIGVSLAGVAILFPYTLFGLFTNHTEVIELIGVYVFWLLPVLVVTSVGFVLEAYFLGLTEGETVRNVSLISFIIGFTPTAFVAWKLHSNHILWLALCLYFAVKVVSFGVQLPRTFRSNIKDGTLSALEAESNLPADSNQELASLAIAEEP